MTTVAKQGFVAAFLLASVVTGCGGDPTYEPATPPYPPPPPPTFALEPLPEPYPATGPSPSGSPPDAAAPAASCPPGAPPEAQGATADPALVRAFATGQWVYLVDRGWIWVPADSTTADVDGVPYVALYTPSFGWTWYVSPWGLGPYHYGVWFRHPWHPPGAHGYWVAHPRAIDRLGPAHRRR
jgi:hypothetical protein